MRAAIIAALPGELKPLVRGWRRRATSARGVQMWSRTDGNDEAIAVCGGMGAEAALRSFGAADALGPLDVVLSVGWAGALDRGMNAGECYVASDVIDARTGERFALANGVGKISVVTTAHVADEAEKRRLRESYGAALVDMEAAAVARLAQMRGLPMHCFKAVSDDADAQLPDLNPFISDRGQLRLLPFLAHVAVRPRFWVPLARLGRNSAKAADALAIEIERFLEEKSLESSN
jgi:adenosylhomocysteine nucleosidase